jgi:uncharacterized protein (AIM24 family)
MNYRIIGHETQLAEITLQPGQSVRSATGTVLTMDPGIEMETKMEGFSKAMARWLTGESFFISDFTNTTSQPAKVIRVAAARQQIAELS